MCAGHHARLCFRDLRPVLANAAGPSVGGQDRKGTAVTAVAIPAPGSADGHEQPVNADTSAGPAAAANAVAPPLDLLLIAALGGPVRRISPRSAAMRLTTAMATHPSPGWHLLGELSRIRCPRPPEPRCPTSPSPTPTPPTVPPHTS